MTNSSIFRTRREDAIVRRVRMRSGAAAIVATFISANVALAGNKIYLSYENAMQGVPVYSDRALNSGSRVVISLERTSEHVANATSRARGGAMLRSASGTLAARRNLVEPMVRLAARKHGVDEALLKAVIEVESGFNAQALSPKGAAGLMQVMPATAARYGQFNLFSPEQNIDVGTRYLRDLLSLFDGNVRLAVAAYNAGEQAVLRHGRQVPAYAETLRYVPMVLERYRGYLPRENAASLPN